MRRGTTPTVLIDIDMDLTGWDYWLTFSHRYGKLTKTSDECLFTPEGEGGTVSVTLSQEETLSFPEGGIVRVQLRMRRGDRAVATDIASVRTEEILLEGVV